MSAPYIIKTGDSKAEIRVRKRIDELLLTGLSTEEAKGIAEEEENSYAGIESEDDQDVDDDYNSI